LEAGGEPLNVRETGWWNGSNLTAQKTGVNAEVFLITVYLKKNHLSFLSLGF